MPKKDAIKSIKVGYSVSNNLEITRLTVTFDSGRVVQRNFGSLPYKDSAVPARALKVIRFAEKRGWTAKVGIDLLGQDGIFATYTRPVPEKKAKPVKTVKTAVPKNDAEFSKGLIGKKLVAILPLTKEEINNLAWYPAPYRKPYLLQFEDGSYILPVSDAEGNDAGELFGFKGKGEYILTVTK
jgi:hypothetical protein